ncbi:MAG: hypothetical protein JRJ77_09215 [Deltaproteobacteria bacterium]|nr:hypothetical protein [Deltaproteobacteria bacterium]MBW2339779.1 hypothetical protein [Deltaproteobacteria bacterium]
MKQDLRRWGSEAQATHLREGEAGYDVLLKGKMGDTSRSQTVSTRLQQIAKQAEDYPQMVFTTLAHYIDVDLLREAYRHTRKNSSPGVDGITAKQYGEDLEASLIDLHERLKSGRYKAPPVLRAWLEKDNGKKRPIGKPTFGDKIVQRAGMMLLEPIGEQYKVLCSKLRGFYQYYGVRSNYKALEVVFEYTQKAWRRWLSRRSHKGKVLFEEIFERSIPYPCRG